jgi:cytochrome c-type biogenesis protein CcmH/NrfG
MAPTTVTTIVLVLFALGVLALTAYAWFGSWDLLVQRPVRSSSEDEIEAAVLRMRRAIEEYEHQQRSR